MKFSDFRNKLNEESQSCDDAFKQYSEDKIKIDQLIGTIKANRPPETTLKMLMKKYKISDADSEYINDELKA